MSFFNGAHIRRPSLKCPSKKCLEDLGNVYVHCICMAMSVWLCMFVYCICMYGYVCMAMYAWLCMHGYVCMAMYAWLCMHGYVCMAMYAWLCMYGHLCMHDYVLYVARCMYICTYVCICGYVFYIIQVSSEAIISWTGALCPYVQINLLSRNFELRFKRTGLAPLTRQNLNPVDVSLG